MTDLGLYYILFYLSARVTKSNLRKLCLLMWLASMLFMVFVVFKKSNPTWYRTVLIYFLPPYCGDSPLLLTILVYSITCIVAVGVNKASAMLHR